jgi:hypothetical protein
VLEHALPIEEGSRMTTIKDTRQERVTITLTMEEWDSLGFGATELGEDAYADTKARRYARDRDGQTRQKIARATPGAADRRACALAEVEAKVPKLDEAAKAVVRSEVKRLYKLWQTSKLRVDHLGFGEDHHRLDIGFEVTLIPHTVDGQPAFHFALNPQVWFEGNQFPIATEDRDWFIDLVDDVTTEVLGYWNEQPGPWVSVRFR